MTKDRIALYPGTFDPVTLGHIDIIQRSCRLFDKVIVTLAKNMKKKPLFSLAERKEMVEDAVKHLANVSVDAFDGLLIDYAKARNVSAIVRGLRAVSDFEFEFQMALMNRHMAEEITTVFLMPHEKFTYLNSTIIRDVANFGGDVRKFTTDFVAQKLKDKYKNEV